MKKKTNTKTARVRTASLGAKFLVLLAFLGFGACWYAVAVATWILTVVLSEVVTALGM